jgi:hypothetical protein
VLVRDSRVASVDVAGSKSRGIRLDDTESKVTTAADVAPVQMK